MRRLLTAPASASARPSTSNGFKAIALGHRRSVNRVNLASASTSNKVPPCTPHEMERLGTDRSYPSGHASTGTAWALILTELAPDRAIPVLKRGQAFAESRVICNMHWQSDTTQGRFMGAYSYSRLQANPEFQADMREARRELAAARAKNLPPTRDCEAEADALKIAIPLGDAALKP